MTTPADRDETPATERTPESTRGAERRAGEETGPGVPGQRTVQDADPNRLPEQFGRYRIERELGRGGMGAVFLAHDRQLERKVALKIPIFEQHDDTEAIERFYREARAMATVQHANLCPVFDVGRYEYWHYLTMAYIEGETLSHKLKHGATFDLLSALVIVRKVATAVQKAHEAGIVHRDLKPANIMVTRENEPIILDFGLARRRQPGDIELTRRGEVIGSPAYMAPEQVEARHHDIGPPTDVYALGLILYKMVVGRLPFEGSVASIFGQIVSGTPDAPSRWVPQLPRELDSICLKAIAKLPTDRYASAADFAADVARLMSRIGDETISFERRPGAPIDLTGTQGVSPLDTNVPSCSRLPRQAEVRQVTVAIFHFEAEEDSSATTSASYSEVLNEQAQSFANFVSERVTHFGGALVAGMGQEVIACFGFPQAYEDAAQRAVRSAMQIQRDLVSADGSNLYLPRAEQTWMTIHSGEAVVELLDSAVESSISLVGEARNTAARLDAVTQPGTITISPTTFHRVSLYFECESLGKQRVRGISQPIELFQVRKEAASRNRVELVDPANLTPLVGRDTELTILKDRWEQALEELGQLVLLIGDAGLGKSRLIRELREHVAHTFSPYGGPGRNDLRCDSPVVIELRCSQYHRNTSFFPLVEFLFRLLGLESQAPQERLNTVIRYLRELGLATPEQVSLLCGVLGIPTDDRFPPLAVSPQKLKERSVSFLLLWLKQLLEANPVLFLVEDLHWVDPSTLELLELHVNHIQRGRILSIFTFRPEFETPWKSKSHQTQIALNRLTRRQIAEMIGKRTSRPDIPAPLLGQIIDRTDGIPLFIEEFANILIESAILDRADVDDSSLMNVIPATLHDLLLARLDRMDANREIIQLAATIGREFSFDVLAACSTLPQASLRSELDKLVKAEILFENGEGSAARFIFKHALLQDAAYRSMLSKRRQSFHERIAAVLESEFPHITDSQPELLAHHCTEAGATHKAIEYWLKAGLKSREQSANLEAIQHFRRGIEVTMTLPVSPQRDRLELDLKLPLSAVLMGVAGYGAPEVEPVQNRCIEICRQLGDGAPLFPLLIANWEWLFIRGRYADCDRRCAEVISLAESEQGPGMMSEAHWARVCTSFYSGDFSTVARHAEIGWRHYHRAAASEYSKVTQQNCGPLLIVHHGMALWHLGYPDQALARVHEALDLAIEIKHPFTQTAIEWKVGQTYDFARMGEPTLEHGRRGYKIASEQAFAFWTALGLSCQGVGLKLLGHFDEAVEKLREGIALNEATGANIVFGKYKGHLADALWQIGRHDEAWRMLEEAFGHLQTGERYVEAKLLRWRGDFHLAGGDLDRAETAYREALAVAARQKSQSFELRTTMQLGHLWVRRGRTVEARSALAGIFQRFTEGFNTPDLVTARQLLDEWV